MTLAAEKQLRHVFAVSTGATPKAGNAEYWDGNILWVTPKDLSSLEGYWLRQTRRMITHAGYESCSATVAEANSVVLTKRAPIGTVALLANEACSSQGCPSTRRLSCSFLSHADHCCSVTYWGAFRDIQHTETASPNLSSDL